MQLTSSFQITDLKAAELFIHAWLVFGVNSPFLLRSNHNQSLQTWRVTLITNTCVHIDFVGKAFTLAVAFKVDDRTRQRNIVKELEFKKKTKHKNRLLGRDIISHVLIRLCTEKESVCVCWGG